MAAATVTERVEVHFPGMEVVRLTVSDGETYVSQKFGTIKGAVATGNTDNDAELNVTFTGRTATINWASITDGVATLVYSVNLEINFFLFFIFYSFSNNSF